MSYSVIISRQYHSNSAFEMIFVCYEDNWLVKKKKGLCLYGLNAIISFWMFKWSGMKPKVRARASELSPEPGYLNFRFFQN